MVRLEQTVMHLMGQWLGKAVGQENVSSDVEPSIGSGHRGHYFGGIPVSPVEDEQSWSH